MRIGRAGRSGWLVAGQLALLAAATLPAGCRPRPRAPALEDAPV